MCFILNLLRSGWVSSGSSSVFKPVIIYKLFFQFSCFSSARDSSDQHFGCKTDKSHNSVKQVHLAVCSRRRSIFFEFFKTDSIFVNIILCFVNNFVQMMLLKIFVGIPMDRTHQRPRSRSRPSGPFFQPSLLKNVSGLHFGIYFHFSPVLAVYAREAA